MSVNGIPVKELGTKVLPTDTVAYHGKEVKPLFRLEYFAYHKPASVMVTRHDPEGRFTIYDALKQGGFLADHLNYVGRLDFSSEGMLLLTNDGSLIHALTHPRYRIKKTYRVWADRPLTEAEIQRLLDGIESEGQVLHAGSIAMVPGSAFCYEIDLYEGKNRQIRRMFETLGCRVVRLIRTRFASVKLGDLARGEVRHLTPREVAALKAAGFAGKKSP